MVTIELAEISTFGRDVESGRIDAFVDGVGGGPCGLTIAGPPGIGKTTIWAAGVRRALDRGHAVLHCRTGRSETRFAHGGLADLLRDVPATWFDALPRVQRDALDVALVRLPPTAAGPDPRTVCTAVLGVVRALAEQRPVLIAVDDAAWLDPATTAALVFLARRLRDEPVGFLTTVCADRDTAAPLQLDQAMPHGRLTRLWLRGLEPAALHRIVEQRTGLRLGRPTLLRVQHGAGGNPLFALELARALPRPDRDPGPAAPLPVPPSLDDLVDLVAERLRTLPGDTEQALLHVAALAQPHLDTVLVAIGATEGRPSALAAAEEDGIITVDRGLIRFTHPLLASVIYHTAAAERRRLVHRRLAEVVSAPEERVRHLALADDAPDGAVSAALERAAATVQRSGAPAAAVDLWHLARARTPAAHPDDARRRDVRTAGCLFAAGDAEHARRLLQAVLRVTPPGPERAATAGELAGVMFFEGGAAPAADMCRQALAELPDAGPAHLRLTAELHLRRAWYSTHDASQQRASARAALAAVRSLGPAADPALAACVLAVAAMYELTNGGPIAWADLDRAARLLPAGDPTWAAQWAGTTLAAWAKCLDPRDARTRFERQHQDAVDTGDEATAGHTLMHLAEINCWLGEWPTAAHQAERSVELVEHTGQRRWLGFSLYAKASVAAHRGLTDEATAACRRGLELTAAFDDPYIATLHRQVLGLLELSRGDPARADGHFTHAARLVTGMGIVEPVRFLFHGDQIEAAAALGDLDRARDLLAAFQARLRTAPRAWLAAAVARAEAVVLLAEGAAEEADAAAGRALAGYDLLGLPFDAARALLVRGRARRVRRQKAAARDSLTRARQLFQALGAALWTGVADADLERCGQRHSPGDTLTPTERQVATLVVGGMSNREVAALIHVSPKTVEVNLTRIYRKLGVRSRRELARSGRVTPPA